MGWGQLRIERPLGPSLCLHSPPNSYPASPTVAQTTTFQPHVSRLLSLCVPLPGTILSSLLQSCSSFPMLPLPRLCFCEHSLLPASPIPAPSLCSLSAGFLLQRCISDTVLYRPSPSSCSPQALSLWGAPLPHQVWGRGIQKPVSVCHL